MDTPEPRTAATHPDAGAPWEPPLPDAPGFAHEMVATPGLRTHVASIGEGEPIVLLHGFPEHWWQWHEIGMLLAQRGYRAICPDLRGAGWTEAADPVIRRETRLHDLIALLDALGIERTHVLSHDMGAITGMQLAYAHPHRVRSMVQLAVPPFFMSFSPKLVPGFAHLPRLMFHDGQRSVGYLFSARYLARPLSDADVEAYLRAEQRPEVLRAVRPLVRGMVIAESMRIMRGVAKRMRLEPPTLIAFGRQDAPWTERNVERACRGHEQYADRMDFAFVDDAAHFVTDDAPRAVADLALDWFERTG